MIFCRGRASGAGICPAALGHRLEAGLRHQPEVSCERSEADAAAESAVAAITGFEPRAGPRDIQASFDTVFRPRSMNP